MNAQLDQLRATLQHRLKRAMECDGKILPFFLKLLWKFLHEQPTVKAILSHQKDTFSDAVIQGRNVHTPQLLSRLDSIAHQKEGSFEAFAYGIWEFLESQDYRPIEEFEQPFYARGELQENEQEFYFWTKVRSYIIQTFVEYVLHQLDAQQVLFHQLLRYKTRCECFAYHELVTRINAYLEEADGQKRLEKVLQADLYRYLHDEGVEFSIEPKFTEDMIDILASMDGVRDPILVETKIFKDRVRKPIVDGYWQVRNYVTRYNAASGYLVVYNLTRSRLSFDLPKTQLPYLEVGGITIDFLVIEVPLEKVSASKQGKPELFEFTKDHLITPPLPNS